MNKTLEKILKGITIGGFAVTSFLLPDLGVLPAQGQYLNAQTDNIVQIDQEKKQKKKKEDEKKKKEKKYETISEYEARMKKEAEARKAKQKEASQKRTQDLTSTVKDQPMPSITLEVKHAHGGVYGRFTVESKPGEGTYILDPNNQKIKELPIPENGIVYLVTKSPIKGHKIDMRMEDGTNTPLLNSSGGEFFSEYIDTSDYNLRPGTSDDLEILLEPKEQTASVVVQYEIMDSGPIAQTPPSRPSVKAETQEVKPETKPIDTKPITREPKPSVQTTTQETTTFQPITKAKKKAKPNILEGKFAYLIHDETSNECARTAKGILAEALFASKKAEAFATLLWLRYDGSIITPGYGELRNDFTEFNAGFKYKLFDFLISPSFRGELISASDHYVNIGPSTSYIPDTPKNTFSGFSVGAGGTIGNYNDDYIAAHYNWLKGNQKEKIHVPSAFRRWNYDIPISSEGLTEKYINVSGRLTIGPVTLRGGWSKGTYDNKLEILNGERETITGEALVSLGAASKSKWLKHFKAGVHYHWIEDKNSKGVYQGDWISPIIIYEVPIDKLFKK